MTDEEKRAKIVKHNAKRTGYFIKMLVALASIPVSFWRTINTDGLVSILFFVMVLISVMVVLCFKMLHMGMLYCPLCGVSFNNYGSWFTQTMPYTCPHCDEKLYY